MLTDSVESCEEVEQVSDGEVRVLGLVSHKVTFQLAHCCLVVGEHAMKLRCTDVLKDASKLMPVDLPPSLIQVIVKIKLADFMSLLVLSDVDNFSGP